MKALILVFLFGCLCLLTQAHRSGDGHSHTDHDHTGHNHDHHTGHDHSSHNHDHSGHNHGGHGEHHRGRGWNHDGQQGHEHHNHDNHNHQPGHHHGGHEEYHKRLMRECAVCVRNCRRQSGAAFNECVAADNVCKDVCYPAHSHNIGNCLICIRQCATDLIRSTDPIHLPYKHRRGKRVTFCVSDLRSPCHDSCHHYDGEDN